jgi:hypothetical protein
METESRKVLPQNPEDVTNGGVYLQRRRCGKSNCRCARSDERHIGFYFIQRVKGKWLKTYIRKSELDRVVAIVNKAKVSRTERRERKKEINELVQHLRDRAREYDSIIKLFKENLR